MTMSQRRIRIGYVPISSTLEAPGDRRRFVHYARNRDLHFEVADPAKHYDLVILSQRADLSIWSQYPRGKLVYDLIDSYLAIPRTSLKGSLRGIAKFVSRQSRYPRLDHWKAIEAMCARADAVICSTDEQKFEISRFCPNVHLVLDFQNMVARTVKRDYSANQPFRFVWEGLPSTLASLELLRPVLLNLRRKHPLELHVVTDLQYYRFLGQFGKSSTLKAARRVLPDAYLHKWNEMDCSEIICSCDLAVIPVALDDRFSVGKPENKMLLFWRMGMPVVSSATPAYTRAMKAAGIDLSCSTEAHWQATLERVMVDDTLRRDAGDRGQAYVSREFGDEVLLARWDMVFASLGFHFGAQGQVLSRVPRAEITN